MKIAFIGSASSWYFQDLQRACASEHQLTPYSFFDLRSHVSGTSSRSYLADTPVSEFDAVLVRVMPPGSLEQVVYRMDALQDIVHSGVPVVNSPKAIEAAVDKYLCLAKLARAGIQVPHTLVCQTTDQGLEAFDELGGDVLIKPIFGGEGRGIVRATDKDLFYRCIRAVENFAGVIYIQEFIRHKGFDLRLFVLGEQVFAMQRHNGGHWKTNISAGATGIAHQPSDAEIQLARKSACAIDAQIAGVDVVVDPDGTPYVIEVNAVPGWKALSAATGIDVAADVLKFLAR